MSKNTKPAALPASAVQVAIAPSDTVPLEKPGRIVVNKRGSLSIVAVGNGDVDTINYTDAPKGFVPPYDVRLVRATGTTAAVSLAP